MLIRPNHRNLPYRDRGTRVPEYIISVINKPEAEGGERT